MSREFPVKRVLSNWTDQGCGESQNQRDSLVILTFWTYNLTILVFLVQSDPIIMDECEDRGVLDTLQELLNLFQGKQALGWSRIRC